MAEKALKKVEDQLDCSICLDTYTDPKLLQCFHVYCQKCLVKLVVRDQQGQLFLSCPICRQATPVPANGVAGLQSAFHINRLLEIAEELKKATADPSASAQRVERASTSLTQHHMIKICCPEHGAKEVELYCKTCEEPICLKCAIKGGKHHRHDYEELEKAFEEFKAEITASLEPMEKQVVTIMKALAQLDTRCGEISDQRAAIEVDVHKTFRQLREVLDVRETEVIDQLHKMTQGKLKGLAVRRDQIETIQARIDSCLGFMRESLETDSQAEVLMMKATVVKQVKELTTTFPQDTLKPNTEADIVFSALADVTAACQKYGQVYASGSPDPSKCYATGKGTEEAVVGETSTAILQAVSFSGQPCEEPIESSKFELVSEMTGTRARGSIERRGQSQYEISFQPTIKGRHQLHIKVEGQHIRRSPFSVIAKLPVEKLGTPILTLGGVKGPWGVAINQRGEVVVSEYNAGRVSVFSPSGEKLRSFGTHDSGQGQLQSPCGVAVDAAGNILVADNGTDRIHKFTAEGQFLTAVGTEGSGPPQFDHIRGLAVNATNSKVYISANHHIQVLNSDLTFSSTFGKVGSGKGQFQYPHDIAIDSTGMVYVADYGNHRIQVFTAEGKFLRMFGRYSSGKGELRYPSGIAIDTSDMVYVSEWDIVTVFTSDGGFVTSFGSHGGQPGQFLFPRGLCVNKSGVLYICDDGNNRVQIV